MNLSTNIEQNEAFLREQFHHCSDFMIRSFKLKDDTLLFIAYLDGMIRVQSVEENILKPLILGEPPLGMDRLQSLTEMIRSN
ncbi:spore germination protein [Paenibacillus catalpae]|uniref:spore germination protein n=1 Tax=Paenibacillus catalpae TaxID=1045775 RepID=UPI000AEEF998